MPSLSSSVTVTVVGGVTFGVVEQVLHGTAELVAVAGDLGGGDAAGVDDHPAALAQPACLAQHDVVEVDRSSCHLGGAGVAAGELEEVVDEVLQADRLVEHAALGRGRIGELGLGEVDLELGADPRQRAAQLVRRVGDETLLAADRVLEAVEGLVHRAGEPVDLVAGARFGEPGGRDSCR